MPRGVKGSGVTTDGKAKAPAGPRPVYIVFDKDKLVGTDGKINESAVLLTTRAAKDALDRSYVEDGVAKGLLRVMLR